MQPNPVMGLFYHSVGGLASASFVLPFRKVRHWAWETYWLAGGVFSWVIAPWAFAWVIAHYLSVNPATKAKGISLLAVLREGIATHPKELLFSCLFGVLWGIGHLSFGLTVRYLGLSLTIAVALGFCAVFGTIMQPIYKGEMGALLTSPSGLVALGGVGVCLVGIILCGKAGIGRERELGSDTSFKSAGKTNFAKGMWLAMCCGLTSSCMAFAIDWGKPLGAIAAAKGFPDIFKNTPVLIVVLTGGLLTNVAWCVYLHLVNRTAGDYFTGRLASNYFFSALAGTIWYLQFFFYTMGTTKMGEYDFSSWTLHMSTIIIFGNVWGLILHEWKGTSARVRKLIFLGTLVLITSTIVVGGGAKMKGMEDKAHAALLK